MSSVLEVADLRAGYGATVVLEDVSLILEERATIAVLGRNGVGKTTFLATLMGHTTQHAGKIVFRGRELNRLPPYERARLGIGYVPQAREIFPSLTVEENLTVAGRPGRWSLERVYDILPRLAERRSHMGNQISGGEQQMLAIGRALMGNPTLLLMDEPLEGLAPIIVESIMAVVSQLIREDSLTLVLVEQSAKRALQMTEQALVLDRGRIAYAGPSAQLLNDPERLSNLFVAH
ncbi:MAG: ABC transporter ATP-binding protein [Burkholderiales bacterium]